MKMNYLYGLPKRKQEIKRKEEKPFVFNREEYFTVEEFCEETGQPESFVREAIGYSDEFLCFVRDGVTYMRKSSKQENLAILRRAKNRELF
ncbi:hypothetical protein [Domibacillus robiginosus]|uniref:hypothetical protein n=1 Tax=Domibacillus robiginosus TaxID=1071054 RepID=UPI00067B16C4|nr:hypothetical protein [Domibacillus robiginosus]